MEHVWNMYGISMGYVWNMYEICMGCMGSTVLVWNMLVCLFNGMFSAFLICGCWSKIRSKVVCMFVCNVVLGSVGMNNKK